MAPTSGVPSGSRTVPVSGDGIVAASAGARDADEGEGQDNGAPGGDPALTT
ncbi:MAG: hypothetical protein QM747_19140 [Nocardioides sp.]